MGSRGGGSIGGKAAASSSSSASLRRVWACLALCLLLLLSRCSPCDGRKLLLAEGKVMYLEGDLVLRVPPPPSVVGGEDPAASAVPAVPRAFAATGRAARLMRSVPSPGVGH
ncbi:hypothetical protein SORBI_3009G207800 [Sorghum bicolor]|uniref:Uncharacterized protein n=1 Tax=Sorghum bicolor TaxID=4558 RepID=A0A1B6P9M9_SORBI|nr:hypothetical protein SORBI_3009G207800 [Sorghum bicolor]